MTIGEELVQLLLRDEAEISVVCERDAAAAGIECDAKSALAVSCTSLWTRPAAPPDDVRARAEQLAERIHYLSEPLKLVEFDPIAQEAQLRSTLLRSTSASPTYFEIMLASSGAAKLHRYEYSGDGARRITSFSLTLETLTRLIDDLLAA